MQPNTHEANDSTRGDDRIKHHGFTNAIVHTFLHSNLSLVLVILAAALGVAAIVVTPREEDPQIVVPMADVYVNFPGHSAAEVEQLVTTPLEKLLYQIDGVEYVYSMSHENQAIITVRYYVGEDRERSLVKLYKRIDEHIEEVPPGVAGWVIKPVEIDDVPVVTLTLTSGSVDSYTLRRVAEELVERLAAVENTSRAYVVGGESRTASVYLDPDRMQAHNVSPLEIQRAISATNVTQTTGEFMRNDATAAVEVSGAAAIADDLDGLVVGVFDDRPVFLKDVARIDDGPAEVVSYVRHGWGPARGFEKDMRFPGSIIGAAAFERASGPTHPAINDVSQSAVTIALAKKKGTNAVWVAEDILKTAEQLKHEVIPDNIEMIVTRNYGLTADEKVNELIEGLAVAVFIVIALLTIGLGWREALIVAVAVPVVFGLTLTVNLMFGYTINRVTLFALILALGLLVDDPIVDVENITRHFAMRKRATRQIVQDAIAEIRPPLIVATLAVIVSFLPMFFITGMMGPYMRPMALNVPVTMLMSMLVAFTITPWLAYHVLKNRYNKQADSGGPALESEHDFEAVRTNPLYRLFRPLMEPLLASRRKAWGFIGVVCLLTLFAVGLAAFRAVPLKMLPFDNKNEMLLVLDFDEGTTLERADATVRAFERYVAAVPEVTDFTSYVGLASPMDFNGLVRHYYLRQGNNVAEIRVNFAGKKSREETSRAISLRMRNDLTTLANRYGANLKLVEIPPGPPVISTLTAEIYGRPDHSYDKLIAAAKIVRSRLGTEPGVVDLDDSVEADWTKWVFLPDGEKAAIQGVSVVEIADTLGIALSGVTVSTLRNPTERNPLRIELRLPESSRSDTFDLTSVYVKSLGGRLVPLAELGTWERRLVDKTIYHKNLARVVYVFADTAGRAPADAIVDVLADFVTGDASRPAGTLPNSHPEGGWVAAAAPRPVQGRSFLANGSGVAWSTPPGIRVDFAGEGEWKITLDVFRDLGLAFAAALVAIYILLVGQLRSFAIPIVVMLAIPLTVLGIMPGFWLLNAVAAGSVGGYESPIFFTATGMIGMIALAGIVTRQAVIIVDFVHLSLRRGHSLHNAIMASCVVRLRPILLTVGTAMLSAAPIAIDPIFSGLAWALIFGLFASTLFTLFVIPIAYWLVYANRPGHGLGDAGND